MNPTEKKGKTLTNIGVGKENEKYALRVVNTTMDGWTDACDTLR